MTLIGLTTCLSAEEEPPRESNPPSKCRVRELRSHHLVVHTDLNRLEARAVLTRLTAKLRELSNYWSRSVSTTIHCYVVADLQHWSDEQLDNAYAREVIHRVGGFATRHPSGVRIYTNGDLNVALHELVHAYCLEAFPDSGPVWYKEGMAVLLSGQYRKRAGVRADDDTLQYLRASEHRTARSISRSGDFTRSIAQLIESAVAGTLRDDEGHRSEAAEPMGRQDNARSATNSPGQQRVIDKANASYHWSWALCYFLHNNENYSEQFKQLGYAYLNAKRPRFENVFSHNEQQLEAEFRHFIRQLGPGYQVDLCRWNWDDNVKSITGASSFARVAARRGFQTTKLKVDEGVSYAVHASGTWSVGADGTPVSANGNAVGLGRLSASVLSTTQMGESFELGTDEQFTATKTGTLFLRCIDHWNELGDNRGSLRVEIRQVPSKPGP